MKKVLLFVFASLVFSIEMSAQASGGQITRKRTNTTVKTQGKSQSVKPRSNHAKPSSSNGNVANISEPDGYINGHGYVDLGLPSGTKWATCNVGANIPEDHGYYLAWGEIEPKNNYEYNETPLYGVAIDNISDNKNYDVARIKWGDGWSIPTKLQWDELIRCCKLKTTSKKGINGVLFVGKNGKKLFFPAGGRKLDTLLQFVRSEGHYWSSNADYTYRGNPQYASDGYSTECIISCTTSISNTNPIVFFEPESRGYGLNVRPVTN